MSRYLGDDGAHIELSVANEETLIQGFACGVEYPFVQTTHAVPVNATFSQSKRSSSSQSLPDVKQHDTNRKTTTI